MLIKCSDANTAPAIELTPLIDMVFLLLIFFLVATTFKQEEREMQIALPFASSAGPISGALRELIVNVRADGGIVVGGRSIEGDDLRSLIADAVAVNPQQKVTVRGDREAAYSHIVSVLDICKGSGVQEPYLDTMLQK